MKLRKVAAAVLFVTALMVPTVLGFPLTFTSFSMVQEAEARTRQRSATLREMRINHGRFFITATGPRDTSTRGTATWRTNFIVVPANRSSITMTAVRDSSSNRAQVRYRINNGSWTSWSRSNAQRRVNIPSNNGTSDRSVRVRVQVRSEARNRTTTYNYVIRRASTNTRADRMTVSTGTLNHRFDRARTSYRLTLPTRWAAHRDRTAVRLTLRAEHPRANVVWDSRSTSRNTDGWRFASWPRSNNWQTRRTANTQDFIRVGFGETVRVRFRIMGAYNTMASGSNNTRTYTVNIHRGPATYRQIVNHFAPILRAATTRTELSAIRSDASSTLMSFQLNQSGDLRTEQTRIRYLDEIDAIRDELWPNLPW